MSIHFCITVLLYTAICFCSYQITAITVAGLMMDNSVPRGPDYAHVARVFLGCCFLLSFYQWIAYMFGQPRFIQVIVTLFRLM